MRIAVNSVALVLLPCTIETMPMITSNTGRLLLGVLCGFVLGIVLYQSSGMKSGFSSGSLRATVTVHDPGCGYSIPPEGCPPGVPDNGIYCLPSGNPCIKNGNAGTCKAGTCIESAPPTVSDCIINPVPETGCPPPTTLGPIGGCFYPAGTSCATADDGTGTCNASGTCVGSTVNSSVSVASVPADCTACWSCITACAVLPAPGVDCQAQCASQCSTCTSSSQASVPSNQYHCCNAGACSPVVTAAQCTTGMLYQGLATCQAGCVTSASASSSHYCCINGTCAGPQSTACGTIATTYPDLAQCTAGCMQSSASSASQALCCNGNQCVPYMPTSASASAVPICTPPCIAPLRCVKDPADPAPTCR